MIAIPSVLKSTHIDLSISAPDTAAAVGGLLELLRGDSRVLNWSAFSRSVLDRDATPILANGCGILIAHGRTDSVGSLVMAAGVSPQGIPPATGEGPRIHLVFVAGIPAAFNNDYLRVVGTIARLCGREELLHSLRAADSSNAFLSTLSGQDDRF